MSLAIKGRIDISADQMHLMSIGEFLTLKQTANQYDISKRTIYYLREKGLLFLYKLPGGRKSFVRKSEFENAMQPELQTQSISHQ